MQRQEAEKLKSEVEKKGKRKRTLVRVHFGGPTSQLTRS